MPLVMEDGTGLDTANAYADQTYATAYATLRGLTAWLALAGSAQDIALVKATDYIELRFGARIPGFPLVLTQALTFPKVALYDRYGNLVTGVPDKVKRATVEYAIRASVADLAPDPEVHESGTPVSKKFEKVGPIEEQTDFMVYGVAPLRFRPYPVADRLMAEFLTAGGRNYR